MTETSMTLAERECESVKILERALTCFLEEYREQAQIWQTLEMKAQSAITASGIFLAAAFAFSREPSLALATKAGLFLTLAALLWAFAAAISVLRTSDFDLPLDGAASIQKARELIASPSTTENARHREYLEHLVSEAPATLVKIKDVNEAKGTRLGQAQTFLFTAAYLSIATTLVHFVWPGD